MTEGETKRDVQAAENGASRLSSRETMSASLPLHLTSSNIITHPGHSIEPTAASCSAGRVGPPSSPADASQQASTSPVARSYAEHYAQRYRGRDRGEGSQRPRKRLRPPGRAMGPDRLVVEHDE
jgi:hypothetical protein